MSARIFGDHAWPHWRRGWPVAPLPRGRKFPPPTGYTGHNRMTASGADVAEWIAARPHSNIALVMPVGVAVGGQLFDVVGLDVDDYAKGDVIKRGGDTVETIERAAGAPFPATWKITSRGAGVSGKYLGRVPGGTRLVSALPGVELIQPHHRYAVAPPSVNPDSGGSVFEWRAGARPVPGADGESTDEIPRPADLPVWPPEIIDVLRADTVHVAPVAVGPDEWRGFFAALPSGPPCRAVRERFGAAVEAAYGRSGRSRHEETRNHVLALMRLGEGGHSGVNEALQVLREHYVRGVADSRSERAARAECNRMLRPEAVGLVLATPTPPDQAICVCPEGLAAVLAMIDDPDERAEFASMFAAELAQVSAAVA